MRKLLLPLVALLLFSCNSPTDPGASMSGVVTNRHGQLMTASNVALVSSNGVEGLDNTGENGRYGIVGQRPGRYFLYVYQGQMEVFQQEINLPPGHTVRDIVTR